MNSTSLPAPPVPHPVSTLPPGTAHTFFVGANDKPRAGELINVLREAKQQVPEELLKFGTTGASWGTAARSVIQPRHANCTSSWFQMLSCPPRCAAPAPALPTCACLPTAGLP